MSENKTSENKRDYEVGRGKPPVHSRFKKGQSSNPRGPSPKNLAVLLVEALNEKAVVNHRRQAGGMSPGGTSCWRGAPNRCSGSATAAKKRPRRASPPIALLGTASRRRRGRIATVRSRWPGN